MEDGDPEGQCIKHNVHHSVVHGMYKYTVIHCISVEEDLVVSVLIKILFVSLIVHCSFSLEVIRSYGT